MKYIISYNDNYNKIKEYIKDTPSYNPCDPLRPMCFGTDSIHKATIFFLHSARVYIKIYGFDIFEYYRLKLKIENYEN